MILRHQNRIQPALLPRVSRTDRIIEIPDRVLIEPEDERALLARHSSPPIWEGIIIWSGVVLSFAALLFVGYVIWAKCHGQWPS